MSSACCISSLQPVGDYSPCCTFQCLAWSFSWCFKGGRVCLKQTAPLCGGKTCPTKRKIWDYFQSPRSKLLIFQPSHWHPSLGWCLFACCEMLCKNNRNANTAVIKYLAIPNFYKMPVSQHHKVFLLQQPNTINPNYCLLSFTQIKAPSFLSIL